MLWLLIHIVESLLWLLLAASTAYILFFALASKLPARKHSPDRLREARDNSHVSRFLILFPAYHEDGVIVDSVKAFLHQQYPEDYFRVAVISDHMLPATNDMLRQLPVTLLTPTFKHSSKAKAMQHAIRYFRGERLEASGKKFDHVVILDADNMVEPDFLCRLNAVCLRGYQAIQCHRCAKNADNDIAILDGISEEINNTLFRRGHNRIGLSSALIGSGMCFDYRWFADNVHRLATAGEDRELEELLLKQKIHIHYEETIPVYDEKVSSKENFQRQRLRWMTAQVQSLLRMLPYIPTALRPRNFAFIDKTMQQALIPRSILIVLTFVFTLLLTLLVPVWSIKWWCLLASIILSLILASPIKLYDRDAFSHLSALPSLVWKMLMNLRKLDRKSTEFTHTTHEV